MLVALPFPERNSIVTQMQRFMMQNVVEVVGTLTVVTATVINTTNDTNALSIGNCQTSDRMDDVLDIVAIIFEKTDN